MNCKGVSFHRTATLNRCASSIRATAFIMAALLGRESLAADVPASAAPLLSSISFSDYSLLVFYGGLLSVGMLISVILSVWKFFRPEPPYDERFAQRAHSHLQYMEREEYLRIAMNCAVERKSLLEKIDSSLTALRHELHETNLKDEERASLIHGRVNSLVGPLNSVVARVDEHLAGHHNQGARR